MSSSLRREIHQRALGRCEYCLLSQEDAFFPHEPDHVIAEKHGGATTVENLALACFDCNRFKGSDIASIDPDTGNLVALFNPRRQEWKEHFSLGGGLIIALTSIGSATVRLLKLNLPARVEAREALARRGRYP
ncbi:MAG: HNH endonuclease signature motif containing protein [Acidobacteriota bacterium]